MPRPRTQPTSTSGNNTTTERATREIVKAAKMLERTATPAGRGLKRKTATSPAARVAHATPAPAATTISASVRRMPSRRPVSRGTRRSTAPGSPSSIKEKSAKNAATKNPATMTAPTTIHTTKNARCRHSVRVASSNGDHPRGRVEGRQIQDAEELEPGKEVHEAGFHDDRMVSPARVGSVEPGQLVGGDRDEDVDHAALAGRDGEPLSPPLRDPSGADLRHLEALAVVPLIDVVRVVHVQHEVHVRHFDRDPAGVRRVHGDPHQGDPARGPVP